MKCQDVMKYGKPISKAHQKQNHINIFSLQKHDYLLRFIAQTHTEIKSLKRDKKDEKIIQCNFP